MFIAAPENVSLKENVTPKFFNLFFSFLGIASLNYGENLKKIFQKAFLLKVTGFYFPAMITQ